MIAMNSACAKTTKTEESVRKDPWTAEIWNALDEGVKFAERRKYGG
jgi:hypothetical protein